MSQTNQQTVLQSAVTTTANGATCDTSGQQHCLIEIQETAGGTATATVNIEGSFDGTTWYAAGYQQVDNTASPARAVAGVSVTASAKHVYQVVDFYPQTRARISAIANSGTVTAKAYTVAI